MKSGSHLNVFRLSGAGEIFENCENWDVKSRDEVGPLRAIYGGTDVRYGPEDLRYGLARGGGLKMLTEEAYDVKLDEAENVRLRAEGGAANAVHHGFQQLVGAALSTNFKQKWN